MSDILINEFFANGSIEDVATIYKLPIRMREN